MACHTFLCLNGTPLAQRLPLGLQYFPSFYGCLSYSHLDTLILLIRSCRCFRAQHCRGSRFSSSPAMTCLPCTGPTYFGSHVGSATARLHASLLVRLFIN